MTHRGFPEMTPIELIRAEWLGCVESTLPASKALFLPCLSACLPLRSLNILGELRGGQFHGKTCCSPSPSCLLSQRVNPCTGREGTGHGHLLLVPRLSEACAHSASGGWPYTEPGKLMRSKSFLAVSFSNTYFLAIQFEIQSLGLPQNSGFAKAVCFRPPGNVDRRYVMGWPELGEEKV